MYSYACKISATSFPPVTITDPDLNVNVVNIGLPDLNLEHGSREELLAEAGLNTDGILQTIEQHLNLSNNPL